MCSESDCESDCAEWTKLLWLCLLSGLLLCILCFFISVSAVSVTLPSTGREINECRQTGKRSRKRERQISACTRPPTWLCSCSCYVKSRNLLVCCHHDFSVSHTNTANRKHFICSHVVVGVHLSQFTIQDC